MKITKIAGLGNANARVITKNNTYIINTRSARKITEIKNNCYIEWVTNSKGQITGLVEVFFSKILVNGRMQEKVIGKWGDVSSLL